MKTITADATPSFSTSVAVALRNERVAEEHPPDVVQRLMDNANYVRVANVRHIQVPLASFRAFVGAWDRVDAKYDGLRQVGIVDNDAAHCEISGLLPRGATVTGLAMYVAPAAGHVALPNVMPQIQLLYIARSNYATDLESELASVRIVEDTSADVAAYEESHAIEAGAGVFTPYVTDVMAYRYFLALHGELSTNAISDMLIHYVSVGVEI